MDTDILKQLFGEDFAHRMAQVGERKLEMLDAGKEEIADLRELARGVFSTEAGSRLLHKLTQITYQKPVYPPPSGQDAGEYAAQCEGQRQIVAMLINWSKQET